MSTRPFTVLAALTFFILILASAGQVLAQAADGQQRPGASAAGGTDPTFDALEVSGDARGRRAVASTPAAPAASTARTWRLGSPGSFGLATWVGGVISAFKLGALTPKAFAGAFLIGGAGVNALVQYLTTGHVDVLRLSTVTALSYAATVAGTILGGPITGLLAGAVVGVAADYIYGRSAADPRQLAIKAD